MPNTLGTDLQGYAERYHVSFDKSTRAWRIIDLKDPEISKVQDIDEDIPDDNPAVTVIPELAFAKLIAEAIREGVLNPSVVGLDSDAKDVTDLKAEVLQLSNALEDRAESLRLKDVELQELRIKSQQPQGSEEYLLKRQVVDTLQKIVIAEDLREIK